jgi:hypothetical protein
MDPREGSTAKTHPGGVLDSAGSLRLSIAEPGAVEVELSPPGEAGSTARFQLPQVNLVRGDNPLALSFETGSVRGQVLAPAPDVSVMVQVDSTSAPRLVCYADARPDAQGRFEVPFVMAGRARVSRMKQLDEGGTFGPVGETTIDVPARGTVDVSVP